MYINEFTLSKIDKIHEVIKDENDCRNILLTGGGGVGKTFLAKKLALRIIGSNEDDINNHEDIQIISFHPGFSYEDFIEGVEVTTENEKIVFQTAEKIFLKMIDRCNQDENNKVLILDDINRSNMSSVFGEILTLLENHNTNSSNFITLPSGNRISIPENLYIIATMNTSITTQFRIDYAFYRRFLTINIERNFDYIKEENEGDEEKTTLSRINLYNEIKDIVRDNLSDYYVQNDNDRNKYLIGHGYFNDKERYLEKIEYQVIPILKQYIKDGILNNEAEEKIMGLEREINSNYITDYETFKKYDIEIQYINKKYDKYLEKQEWLNKPGMPFSARCLIVNLIERNLISNLDLYNNIIYNPDIATRCDKGYIGYLYGLEKAKENIKDGGGTGCYNKNDYLTIKIKNKKIKYYSPNRIAYPKSMSTNPFFLNNENETSAFNVNVILNLIVKTFYEIYIERLDGLIKSKNTNEKEYVGYRDLLKFVKTELTNYIDDIINYEKNDKETAFEYVKQKISELKILWAERNDIITDEEGNEIKVIGVYGMSEEKDYFKIMKSLGVKQMILQGPPGTSKTHTSKEIIRGYIEGEERSEISTSELLGEYQISKECYEKIDWDKEVGWDMIQFHPSYGYEDFVRGISIETKRDNKKSFVSYDTIDKTLGKMAKLATKYNEKKKFFLIIDEINRANLATVFGELIYGLEYRGEGVATPYTVNNDNKINIPENLYIIGTMNTADKSIGGIDYAIRRRFLFFPLLPDESVIKTYYIKNEVTEDVKKSSLSLFKAIDEFFEECLSEEYYKDDVQIGHTYFLVNNEKELESRFEYQILPILREYYKDGLFNEIEKDDNTKKIFDLIKNNKYTTEIYHEIIEYGKQIIEKEEENNSSESYNQEKDS